ncbi:MAG: PocR ligand-binding domain-containing protein [Spirochaetales bacterium]|nr:PocR ligand-binding domain-containing protein [Spirochaetales bacterium]
MEEFYRVTHLNTILKNVDGDVLAIFVKQQKQCEFCKMIYSTDLGGHHCYESDQNGLKKAIKTKKPVLYKCHLGLTDAVIPLFVKDSIVGTILTGQYYSTGNPPIDFKEISEKYGLDEGELKRTFNDLVKADDEKILFYINSLFWLINYVISVEMQFLERIEDNDNYYMNVKIGKATDIIKQRYNEQLNEADLARELSVSRSHFSASFKKFSGISFKEFLILVRMENARKLLKSTYKSITEIGYEVGYSDSNYFSTLFRKEMGMSPKEFRKQTMDDTRPETGRNALPKDDEGKE